MRVLLYLALNLGGDALFSRKKIRINPRTKRAECVEALASSPLAIALLNITSSNVIGNGVSENYIFITLFRNIFTDSRNHNR